MKPFIRNHYAVSLLLTITVTARAQPVVTDQPQSQLTCVGTAATFTVGVTGAEPFSYQWQTTSDLVNYTDRPGCTNATLVLTNVQTMDFAFYRAVITNVGGAATSLWARLDLVAPLVLLSFGQPTNWPSVSLGATVGNRVAASGNLLSYQWRLNGEPLAGQTKSTISLTNVQMTDAGSYDVVVANICGSTNSRTVTLVVDPTFTKITGGPVVSDRGGSVCFVWWDYDNDDVLDLFVGNYGTALDAFYHNAGGGTFTPITTNAIALLNAGMDAAAGDYDNDGKVDLFVARWGSHNDLFRNEGSGRFTRMTSWQVGPPVSDGGKSYGATWADYDNDGFIDLFVASGARENDCLYRNDGDGSFTKMTTNEVGLLVADGALSWTGTWADCDNDGDLDVYVTLDGATNYLYRNDGNGNFSRIVVDSLIVWGSSSPTWGDYDNDGFLDLFVTRTSGCGLYRNLGDLTFSNVTSSAGLNRNMNTYVGAWGDYDNDGYLDLFVQSFFSTNALYHNNGDGTFTSVNAGSPLTDGNRDLCAGWGDYDNDGFLDLYIACGNGQLEGNLLYRNNGNCNHWLKTKLRGTASNRSAIGAKVRVKATIGGKTTWQMREISGNSAWSGGIGLPTHFGLGDATNADLVRIEWPSGIVQTLTNVATDQMLSVAEHQNYVGTSPAFTGAVTVTNGLQVSIVEPVAGAVYSLEASTDLMNWTKLMARTSAGGTFVYTDTCTAHYLRRFYRVVVP